MPACGFGAGDVTTGLLLDALALWPTGGSRVDFYIAAVCDEAMTDAMAYAARVRRQGHRAQVSLSPLGVNRILKTAATCNAKFAAMVGDPECPKGHMRLRDMAANVETVHPLDYVPSDLGV